MTVRRLCTASRSASTPGEMRRMAATDAVGWFCSMMCSAERIQA